MTSTKKTFGVSLNIWIKALRIHHWIKGMFIFLPLVFGNRLFSCTALRRTALYFFFFGVVSSAMYLFNDVRDLGEDRSHPEKRKRPLASGAISARTALIIASFLLAATIPLAYYVSKPAGVILCVYVALNFLYSRFLKHAVIIDVFCLGAFFYLRLITGAITSGVELSNWILICTVLLALFLGFNKRRYDIDFSKNDRPVMSKYDKYFLDRMISVIASSLVMAYSLYVIDSDTVTRFGTNHLL